MKRLGEFYLKEKGRDTQGRHNDGSASNDDDTDEAIYHFEEAKRLYLEWGC